MMLKILLTLGCACALSTLASAQDTQPAQEAPTVSKPASKKGAKAKAAKEMDLDSFFKKAEEQTKKAQEHGGPNCVPKAESKIETDKPVS